jgi:hypothetical protein
MELEKFAGDFIHRLDTGEFDGRVVEVADKLSRDQLLAVHKLLLERERRWRETPSTWWRDATLNGI